MDQKFESKWESNSLIFDKDYGYDGLSWRQRNFMCNFCKKEYKSAQALGGHMNVHRRDRARLRLSSPSHDHPNPNPNPNPTFSLPPSTPLLCLPAYKTYHSSLFPLSSPSLITSKEDKQETFPRSPMNFLGDLRKNINMEGSRSLRDQESECRVWKQGVEMEMGLLKDGKIEMGLGLGLGLDLELRLGRS